MPLLNTQILSVTVYVDRARLSRRGVVRLEPGLHHLEIPDLPLRLNLDSLRASAYGTAGARLLGVQAQRAFFAEAPVEQIRALEKQVETLQDSLKVQDLQVELLKQNRAATLALANHTEIYATALASGEISVEAQLGMLDGLHARAGQIDTELQAISHSKRDLERELQKAKNELDRWRGIPRREQYTASVEIEVIQAGDLSVELNYVVSGAAWQPLYDIRLVEENGAGSTAKPRLEINYLAQVTQRTGEAWPDVELVLSTARPALAGMLPELDPWYVRPASPPIPQAKLSFGLESAPAPMQATLAGPPRKSTRAVSDEAEQAAAAEAATASVDASGAAVTYHVPSTVAIPSDGAPHKVTIASYRLNPRLDYVAAPRLVEAVYRRARVNNDSPYTLLPGMANLFAGDEFIGVTRLELVAPQGEIELYLGPDDRVKIERELKRREVDKRLIGSKRRLLYGYEIRVENLLPTSADLVLHDQIPVSRHEDIKVRLESTDPKVSEQNELNLLKWEFSLPPKSKRTLRFDFSVEYPQSMEVVGLP